jgi:hypothetical protein
MLNLAHFFITRFSVRCKDTFNVIDGPTFLRNSDPLDPERPNLRFKLFEFSCLPAVIGQTDQRFVWIILVDRDLPERFHRRLLALTRLRDRSFIHVVDSSENLAGVQWLRRYAPGEGHFVTTNLDDDDCIPTSFVATLRRNLAAMDQRSALPPIGIVGAVNALEWDLAPSAAAPLGWKSPWHRGRWMMSVGFSLHCRVPEFDVSMLGLRHTLAERYFDFARAPANRNTAWFQRTVVQSAKTHRLDPREWDPASLLLDISTSTGPVLMLNHVGNDQATRLLEPKARRVPVSGGGDFPAFAIDWPKAGAYFDTLKHLA